MYGYLASSTYAVYGQYNTNRFGYLGGTYGACGQYASGKYGILGHSDYGVYGSYDANNHGYIGGYGIGISGSSTSSSGSSQGGYFYSEFTGSGNPSYTDGIYVIANGKTQDTRAVYGYAYGSDGFKAGGYFSNATGGYAYVGYNTDAGGGGTSYKIYGSGTVSEIIPTKDHGRITMMCPESPEYWYIDYVTVKLVGGKAHCSLDPILKEICVVDSINVYKVFTQVNIPGSYGVMILNKTVEGFDIVENNNGQNNGEIDLQIVLKPKTNYGTGRFVQAPGPAFLKKDREPLAAKASNQGNSQVFNWPPDWIVYNYDPADYTPIGGIVEGGKYQGMIKVDANKFISRGEYDENMRNKSPQK